MFWLCLNSAHTHCINSIRTLSLIRVCVPGEYRVGIKFNDQHIPDSPYKLFISPAQGDAHKLEVAQFPTTGVQADKPAQFLVRKNGAKGQLDAKVS